MKNKIIPIGLFVVAFGWLSYSTNLAYHFREEKEVSDSLLQEQTELISYEKQLRELDQMKYRIDMEEFFTPEEMPNAFDQEIYITIQNDYDSILEKKIETEEKIEKLQKQKSFHSKKAINPFYKQ